MWWGCLSTCQGKIIIVVVYVHSFFFPILKVKTILIKRISAIQIPNTVGVYDFSGELNGAMTAHPRVCPETGELLFFGYSMMGDPFLTYYRVNADGSMTQKEDITLPRSVMMHDWAVTRNYVIFMDLPIVSDMNLAVKTGSPFGFMPECGARLGVMPRNGTNSDIKWFEIFSLYL